MTAVVIQRRWPVASRISMTLCVIDRYYRCS